jgi:hypothetical protein
MKPRVVVSRCVEFEPVRCNGQMMRSEFVKPLLPFMEPMTVCPEAGILRSWVVRFNESYIGRQTFFNLYPEELVDVDSMVEACGGRDCWKDEEERSAPGRTHAVSSRGSTSTATSFLRMNQGL